VGHAHPRVAAAVSEQLFQLNTNSRYLHEGLVTFAERLAGTMPDPLSVVFPVCSGSEANDLAWRIAAAAAAAASTSAPGACEPLPLLHVAVVDHAYHGHTTATLALSPYKFYGPGGAGREAHVHVIPCPDTYRGTGLDGTAAARAAVAAARAAGGRLAAFFCESIVSCGGQMVLPPGFLAGVYAEMRAAGAVCVADEVQCGFGRVGAAFWAYQLQGVVPDIVTCGKPMGNGFPMAALVTTRALADRFAAGGMEFFATYGGSTAAAAAGLAVLDVLRDERLQEHALEVGAYALARLRGLQAAYPDAVGDVRGVGLMLGVELVADAASKAPAPALARHVKARCRAEHRVLLSTEGPYANVLKIKPPMCFSRADVDRLVGAVEEALEGLTPGAKAALAAQGEGEVRRARERRAALGAR
jgi:ethanolamine-phosphate phospho-lyase